MLTVIILHAFFVFKRVRVNATGDYTTCLTTCCYNIVNRKSFSQYINNAN